MSESGSPPGDHEPDGSEAGTEDTALEQARRRLLEAFEGATPEQTQRLLGMLVDGLLVSGEYAGGTHASVILPTGKLTFIIAGEGRLARS